ncbi:MAG: sulfurtransferase TusA family protein [Elusimicrobia bacterium HGW-Elusimicrobia-1]|jgi:TusA-related sulfurtransferase|nr:MAG: sulfurtransferase TusA family protein [Elusimicrobia bacterium HGW-Elusimicrobia-1]
MESKLKKSLDLRGVACPMNFVKTKIALAALQKDELLEVILDEGEPAANVPRSVEGEGHIIVEEQDSGSTVKIVIKKG